MCKEQVTKQKNTRDNSAATTSFVSTRVSKQAEKQQSAHKRTLPKDKICNKTESKKVKQS